MINNLYVVSIIIVRVSMWKKSLRHKILHLLVNRCKEKKWKTTWNSCIYM